MSSLGFTGIAAGDVFPSRFVKVAGDFTFGQATANDPIFGISHAGTNYPPIPEVSADKAATAGQSIRIHKPGERCLLKAGGTVVAGDRLKSDADGKGVAIAAAGTVPQRYGAVALHGGALDELIEVEVVFGVESPA
jgi:hypothetical protein